MNDTPETNAAEERCVATGFKTGYVDVEFACKLERERDEAREERRRAEYDATQETIKNSTLKSQWIAVTQERDQWRECAEMMAAWMRSRELDESAIDALIKFGELKGSGK